MPFKRKVSFKTKNGKRISFGARIKKKFKDPEFRIKAETLAALGATAATGGLALPLVLAPGIEVAREIKKREKFLKKQRKKRRKRKKLRRRY